MGDNSSETSTEQRSARDRIAAAAAEHGWSEAFGDVASNGRIYERAGRVIIIGYAPAGAVTSATRMYGSASTPLRTDLPKDELTQRDRGKVDQILAWLQEAPSAEPAPLSPPSSEA